MKAMQNVWGRRAAASGLALLMAAALPVTALADGPRRGPHAGIPGLHGKASGQPHGV